MTQITLTDEQASAVREAADAIVFCDRQGTPLGGLRKLPVTPEQLQVLEQRLNDNGPWYTTAEVLARLRESAPQ